MGRKSTLIVRYLLSLGPTSACLILSSALIVTAAQASARTEAARSAATVQQVRAAYDGPSAHVGALTSGAARSRALARTDLDADGAQDLVVAYAWHGEGLITLQRGNTDAFAPERQSVYARMQRGYEPDLMAPDARVARVPEAVSLVEAGDFNGDGRADVLAGALGGGLYLMAGDGRGGVGLEHPHPSPHRPTKGHPAHDPHEARTGSGDRSSITARARVR